MAASTIDHGASELQGCDALQDPPVGSTARRGWPLVAHVLLLLVVLGVVAALTHPTIATIDEGSYGSQATLLRLDGTWRYPWRFASIDPTGRWFPIANSSGAGSDWYPYAKHPALPLLQAFTGRLLGPDIGYVLPSLLGVVGACVAGWAITRRIRSGVEGWTFWLLAAGPLLFHATIIWGHALGAALAGLATLGAVIIAAGGSRWRGQAAIVGGLIGVLAIRSEGLLFGLALLLALGVVTVFPARPLSGSDDGRATLDHSWPARCRAALGAVGPGLLALGAARVLERAWVTSIVGSAPHDLMVHTLDTRVSWVDGRLRGLWASTLSGSDAPTSAMLPVVLAAVLVVVAFRRRFSPVVLAVAIAGYGLLMLVQRVVAPTEMVTGLVPAWPLISIGVLACGRELWRSQRLLAITVVITSGGVWATQYADGGSFQWGGRFLMVLAVPLAVVAAVGLSRLRDELSVPSVRSPTSLRAMLVFSSMVLLMAASAIAPVAALRSRRTSTGRTYDAIAQAASPVTISVGGQLPRYLWRYDDIEWLHVPRAELPAALAGLRRLGLRRVAVVSPGRVTADDVARFGRITDRVRIHETMLSVTTVEPG